MSKKMHLTIWSKAKCSGDDLFWGTLAAGAGTASRRVNLSKVESPLHKNGWRVRGTDDQSKKKKKSEIVKGSNSKDQGN
jgi:hypothetical protein